MKHFIMVNYVNRNENMIKLCVWSDGTWCEWEDLESYLQWMSDDFQVAEMTYEQYENFIKFN